MPIMLKRILKTKEYTYTAIYESIKEGGYQVSVPLLPGLITYGRTFEEAREMARDAIRCHVEGLIKSKEKVPTEHSIVQEKVSITF